MKTVNIGFNNFVIDERVISIIVPDTSPARRLREDAKNKDMLIDATSGRKTRSIIIMDNGFIILSSVNVETLIQRFEENYKS